MEAAGIISEEINSIYDSFTDNEKFLTLCKDIILKIFTKETSSKKLGTVRKLFSEAYTANGYISYTESLCENCRIWAVSGENTNYTSDLLENIKTEAINRGYFVECFCRPLNPDKIQHMLIPELNLMLKSVENHFNYNYEEVINLHEIMDLEKLKIHISEIENNLHLFDLLIKKALEKLSETKKHHNLLEVFYINSMNFEAVEDLFNTIVSKL